MKTKTIQTKSREETLALGKKLGELAQAGMVFCLLGDLGAGKTTLTQGIGQGLGVTRTINSPTFTILKTYNGRLTLNHMDAYRLEGTHQDLGFEEIALADGLTVVEWPEYYPELLAQPHLTIQITYEDDFTRLFTLEAQDAPYTELVEAL